MQINGIAKQLLSPLSFGSSSSAEVDEPSRSKPTDDSSGIGCRGPAFHEILSRYDVEQITPREFGELVRQLHAAGEIDAAELRDLSRIRADLEQDGVLPDESVDLLDYLADQIRRRQDELGRLSASGEPGVAGEITAGENLLAEKQRQLQWVRKFALVHAAGAEAIDAGA